MKLKNNKFLNSIHTKLFLILCVVIIMIIAFFIIISNAVLETVYYYSKKNASLRVFDFINDNFPKVIESNQNEYLYELEKQEVNNSFEIVILDEAQNVIYCTNKNFSQDFGTINDVNYDVEYSIFNRSEIIYANEELAIRKVVSKKNGFPYILLKGNLKNGNEIFIRISVTPIEQIANVTNKFIFILGVASIILGWVAITFITDRFSKPIEELNDIANEMSNLNFSRKYRVNDSEDEINELGRSINTLSDKLESTINQLKITNIELEKDIEEKSKIDEMRKQFISDVSHELKTPIALIQGYAEGLNENVVTDEEDRKFYTEVILDEANKMDSLVKRLIELIKLEYDERKFNNRDFDIVELINEVVKNSKVVLKENNIEVEFKEKNPVNVYADDFYIEEVLCNYFTNAIKNIKEKDGKKLIKISVKDRKADNKYRVSVFNTGDSISEENLNRIWTRFFKADESRDRSKGGSGIGLSLVKAIMTKYENKYGVTNKKDGVEFYFEVDKSRSDN